MEEKLNLKEEVICDYKVSSNMKKVWQVELDLLEKFIEVCDLYSLEYSIYAGTMIGAIRHKGFIPWDDDIDICMPRDSYNKFLEVAPKYFEDPYFFQCYTTEKYYARGHVQIRNSNTSAFIGIDKYNDFNKGIFIDIFPIDNIPDNKLVRYCFFKKVCFYKKLLNLKTMYLGPDNYKLRIKNLVIWLIDFIGYDRLMRGYERYVSKYNKKKTKCSLLICFLPRLYIFQNKYFDDGLIEVDFEYLKVKCYKRYDEILRDVYGDYMKIPDDKNGSIHGNVFFDPDKSYLEYQECNLEDIYD